MARIAIYSNGPSDSVNSLKTELLGLHTNLIRIRRVNSNFVGREGDVIVNYGSSSLPTNIIGSATVLNNAAAVNQSSHKRRAFQRLTVAGVKTVDYTTDTSVAEEWLESGDLVYSRTVLQGHSGEGIMLSQSSSNEIEGLGPIEISDSLVQAPLYTRGIIQQRREFRLHVIKGVVVYTQQKRRRDGYREDPNYSNVVRNHHTGWIYANTNVEANDQAKDNAIKSVEALGLDFGAVDVITRGDEAWVLEVNTAPGMSGTTLSVYAENFKRILDNFDPITFGALSGNDVQAEPQEIPEVITEPEGELEMMVAHQQAQSTVSPTLPEPSEESVEEVDPSDELLSIIRPILEDHADDDFLNEVMGDSIVVSYANQLQNPSAVVGVSRYTTIDPIDFLVSSIKSRVKLLLSRKLISDFLKNNYMLLTYHYIDEITDNTVCSYSDQQILDNLSETFPPSPEFLTHIDEFVSNFGLTLQPLIEFKIEEMSDRSLSSNRVQSIVDYVLNRFSTVDDSVSDPKRDAEICYFIDKKLKEYKVFDLLTGQASALSNISMVKIAKIISVWPSLELDSPELREHALFLEQNMFNPTPTVRGFIQSLTEYLSRGISIDSDKKESIVSNVCFNLWDVDECEMRDLPRSRVVKTIHNTIDQVKKGAIEDVACSLGCFGVLDGYQKQLVVGYLSKNNTLKNLSEKTRGIFITEIRHAISIVENFSLREEVDQYTYVVDYLGIIPSWEYKDLSDTILEDYDRAPISTIISAITKFITQYEVAKYIYKNNSQFVPFNISLSIAKSLTTDLTEHYCYLHVVRGNFFMYDEGITRGVNQYRHLEQPWDSISPHQDDDIEYAIEQTVTQASDSDNTLVNGGIYVLTIDELQTVGHYVESCEHFEIIGWEVPVKSNEVSIGEKLWTLS